MIENGMPELGSRAASTTAEGPSVTLNDNDESAYRTARKVSAVYVALRTGRVPLASSLYAGPVSYPTNAAMPKANTPPMPLVNKLDGLSPANCRCPDAG